MVRWFLAPVWCPTNFHDAHRHPVPWLERLCRRALAYADRAAQRIARLRACADAHGRIAPRDCLELADVTRSGAGRGPLRVQPDCSRGPDVAELTRRRNRCRAAWPRRRRRSAAQASPGSPECKRSPIPPRRMRGPEASGPTPVCPARRRSSQRRSWSKKTRVPAWLRLPRHRRAGARDMARPSCRCSAAIRIPRPPPCGP